MKLRRMKWRTLYRMWLGGIKHPVKIAVNARPTNITESFMKFLSERFGANFIVVKFNSSTNKEKRLK